MYTEKILDEAIEVSMKWGDWKITGTEGSFCASNMKTGKYLEAFTGFGYDSRFFPSLEELGEELFLIENSK